MTEHKRETSSMKQTQAIEELKRNLSLALDDAIKANRQPLSLVDRASVVDALVAIAGFLHGLDGLTRFAFQFNELASVLSDLDGGAMHPILTPKRTGRGSPP